MCSHAARRGKCAKRVASDCRSSANLPCAGRPARGSAMSSCMSVMARSARFRTNSATNVSVPMGVPAATKPPPKLRICSAAVTCATAAASAE